MNAFVCENEMSEEEMEILRKAEAIQNKIAAKQIQNKNGLICRNFNIKMDSMIDNIQNKINDIDQRYDKKIAQLLEEKESERKKTECELQRAIKTKEMGSENINNAMAESICIHEFNKWSYVDRSCYDGICEDGIHCIHCDLKLKDNELLAKQYRTMRKDNAYKEMACMVHLIL
jgi:hypothetical protein